MSDILIIIIIVAVVAAVIFAFFFTDMGKGISGVFGATGNILATTAGTLDTAVTTAAKTSGKTLEIVDKVANVPLGVLSWATRF